MTDEEKKDYIQELIYDLNDPQCAILDKDKLEFAIMKALEKGLAEGRKEANEKNFKKAYQKYVNNSLATFDMKKALEDARDQIRLEKENAELKQQTESDQLALNESKEIIAELKAQIIDIKEDVERERNKQRRLEHDFTTDVLNSLLQKWELAE